MHALRNSVCLLAIVLSIAIGFHWRMSVMPFDPRYPRVDVPVASNASHICGGVAGPVLSLSRDGTWIHGDAGPVAEEQLRALMGKEGERIHALGLWASVRVRIPKDAPARHFLEINRIAVECGYERMIVSVVRPGKLPRTSLPGGEG